jgi:hypothetical protein
MEQLLPNIIQTVQAPEFVSTVREQVNIQKKLICESHYNMLKTFLYEFHKPNGNPVLPLFGIIISLLRECHEETNSIITVDELEIINKKFNILETFVNATPQESTINTHKNVVSIRQYITDVQSVADYIINYPDLPKPEIESYKNINDIDEYYTDDKEVFNICVKLAKMCKFFLVKLSKQIDNCLSNIPETMTGPELQCALYPRVLKEIMILTDGPFVKESQTPNIPIPERDKEPTPKCSPYCSPSNIMVMKVPESDEMLEKKEQKRIAFWHAIEADTDLPSCNDD